MMRSRPAVSTAMACQALLWRLGRCHRPTLPGRVLAVGNVRGMIDPNRDNKDGSAVGCGRPGGRAVILTLPGVAERTLGFIPCSPPSQPERHGRRSAG